MNIMQIIAQLEKMRQDYNMFRGLSFFCYIFAGIGFLPLCDVELLESGGEGLLVVGVAGLIVALCATSKAGEINKQFRYIYKNTFLVGLLNQYFTNLYCDWDKGFSQDYVREIGLTQMGNRFHSEDYMRGMYKGVEFEQSDVTIKYEDNSGDHHYSYTYFKGRMFSFTCPKTDYMSTVLFSRSFNYKGRGSNYVYENVKMESIAFNNDFKLKSVRPYDAFYILTPQLMECISSLYYRYGNIAMHYYYGKLYLAINMEFDAFDGDMKRPVVYEQEMEKMRWDVGVICDIIDTLSLYPIIQHQPMNQMQYQPMNQATYEIM